VRLTDASLRSLPSGDGKQLDYSDLVQRGLRLRVSPSGERILLLAYRRPRDGQPAKLPIGSISEGMTLKAARQEARDLLALLRREPPIDPAEERAKRRAAATAKVPLFADVCAAWAAEELPHLRPATRKGWARFISAEIVPALGKRRPVDITADDLAELRSTIERGVPGPKAKDGSPTWKRKPAPVSARRCHEVVRRIFAWASSADRDIALARKRHGISRLPTNPAIEASSYRRKRRRVRTRFEAATKAYTDPQLRAIFAAAASQVEAAAVAMREWEAEHPSATRQTRAASTTLQHALEARSFARRLELLALTGVRAHDARAARIKEQFDLGRKLWTIPEHKTSDHTGAPHLVPLSSAALALQARIREENLAAGYGNSPWLFPGATASCEVCDRPGHADKDQKAANRIKAAAGVEGRGLLHRLRDTIKTRMSEHGIDGRVSEAILAHVPAGVVGTYDHAELLPQRRQALEWWGGELARILGEPAPAEARA